MKAYVTECKRFEIFILMIFKESPQDQDLFFLIDFLNAHQLGYSIIIIGKYYALIWFQDI